MIPLKQYTLGIDFGTLSARAVLADVADGSIAAAEELPYPHGVMNQTLPSGKALGRGWALQHPQDYLDALRHTVRGVMAASAVQPQQVLAIGVDFTCTTSLPVLADGTPLCTLPAFADEPNAYVKLWKHHADAQAERILRTAQDMSLSWLQASGGRVSAEWLLPKFAQLQEEAPDCFARTDVYLEAGDWIIWQLCGAMTRSESYAAYKNFYLNGYPDADFYARIGLPAPQQGPLTGEVIPLSRRAGTLCAAMAQELGLAEGTPVAPGMTDSHTGVWSAGLCQSGDVLAILGTSACHILLEENDRTVIGIAGKVAGGIVPGLTAYEANQSMGEVLAWYVDNACPAAVTRAAEAKGVSVHQHLTDLASQLAPGGSGLVALDWFGGNRCILGDGQLSGMILGLTTQTRPEEVYRALMESTVYGMRTILDNYTRQGLEVKRIVAMGGIARKNPLMMQIIADVVNRPVYVSSASEGAAHGTAIAAAVACGVFDTPQQAITRMGQPIQAEYLPGNNAPRYEALYREYLALHDYFGRGGTDVMHRLARG